jgi:hypothetical protein
MPNSWWIMLTSLMKVLPDRSQMDSIYRGHCPYGTTCLVARVWPRWCFRKRYSYLFQEFLSRWPTKRWFGSPGKSGQRVAQTLLKASPGSEPGDETSGPIELKSEAVSVTELLTLTRNGCGKSAYIDVVTIQTIFDGLFVHIACVISLTLHL